VEKPDHLKHARHLEDRDWGKHWFRTLKGEISRCGASFFLSILKPIRAQWALRRQALEQNVSARRQMMMQRWTE